MQSLEKAYGGNPARDEAPATELEGVIHSLQTSVTGTLVAISSVQFRVMPTPPTQGTTDKPRPVATTYADKLREILTAADSLREIVNELSSRI